VIVIYTNTIDESVLTQASTTVLVVFQMAGLREDLSFGNNTNDYVITACLTDLWEGQT
jgi:hypothetical protein